MPEAAQDSFEMVIMKMKSAFMPSVADAHKLLLGRKYVAGESPEKLFADLSRYWKLSTGQEHPSEELLLASVKPFHFCALQPPVAQQLKLSGVVGLGDSLEKSKFLCPHSAGIAER
jgi:hypothetical protein